MRQFFILLIGLFGTTQTLAQKQEFDILGGLILSSSHCASECCPKQEYIYLFEDGNCVFRQIVNGSYYDRLTYFGKWKHIDTIVVMTYTEYYAGEGIGKGEYDPSYGCSGIGYPLYRAIKKSENIQDTLHWNDFKKYSHNSIKKIVESTYKQGAIYRANFKDYNFLRTNISTDAQQILSEQYLNSLSQSDLRLARNEIFAKYGLKFKSTDLMEYFSKHSWYKPIYDNVDAYLNQNDKLNIELINKFEKNTLK